MKLLLTSLVILFMSLPVSAKWVDGYVVDKEGTTIKGKVYLNNHTVKSRSAYVRDGLFLNDYHREVFFKENGKRKRAYGPEDLREYSFEYKGKFYYFESFELEYKSIVKAERQTDRFLQVMYSGHCKLYRNISESLYNDGLVRIEPTIDYYIYNSELGLTMVASVNDYKHLKDILLAYNFDQRYVDGLKKRLNIRDIPQIIIDYELWNEENRQPVFNT
ncbi:hypothetical protein [Carboxylicivirga marina]|uniref:DUF4369 domain-containing protein n=1 Tax=Carboxylicivirga marina TaxID=2800988 RepID=A0ABS1HJ47_9BACT|nr:hypothetical protein [Carboxylicivirga marina]MBK3517318.1 hypothetical protein [Carboxylicivirga marina]